MEANKSYPFIATPLAFADWYLDLQIRFDNTLDKAKLFRDLLDQGWSRIQRELDTTGDVATSGFSEKYFAQYLRKNSSYKITTGARIRHSGPQQVDMIDEDLPVRDDKRSFLYPDIVVLDEVNRIAYDIEIDEPYSYTEKEPIHFLTGWEDISDGDYTPPERIRNGTITAKGLFVIRFAEEQVIRRPQACLDLIKKVSEFVDWYNARDIWADSYALAGWTDEMRITRWTEDEAIDMAQRNYRDTYLSTVTNISSFVKEHTSANDNNKWHPKGASIEIDKEKMERLTMNLLAKFAPGQYNSYSDFIQSLIKK